jgi:hypothetical protein
MGRGYSTLDFAGYVLNIARKTKYNGTIAERRCSSPDPTGVPVRSLRTTARVLCSLMVIKVTFQKDRHFSEYAMQRLHSTDALTGKRKMSARVWMNNLEQPHALPIGLVKKFLAPGIHSPCQRFRLDFGSEATPDLPWRSLVPPPEGQFLNRL